MFVLSEKSPQQIVGSPDLLDIIVLNVKITDRTAIDLNCVSVNSLHHRSDLTDRLEHNINVVDIRQIVDQHGLIRHDRRCQDCESRIFGAAYLHFSHQWIAAFDHILLHFAPRL